MPRDIFRRFKKLRVQLGNEAGDVETGDFVRIGWSGLDIGIVESVNGDCATVFWHKKRGHREIIQLKFLRRAAADPSFGPDVRDA
jgi:hypothetical protein